MFQYFLGFNLVSVDDYIINKFCSWKWILSLFEMRALILKKKETFIFQYFPKVKLSFSFGVNSNGKVDNLLRIYGWRRRECACNDTGSTSWVTKHGLPLVRSLVLFHRTLDGLTLVKMLKLWKFKFKKIHSYKCN